jgi:hypothetical protein
MAETKIEVRLAIREEGKWVNAYLSEPGTMEGALLLGSILTSILENDDEIFLRWKSIMQDVLARGLEDLGIRMTRMEERPAPPHEKAGNG